MRLFLLLNVNHLKLDVICFSHTLTPFHYCRSLASFCLCHKVHVLSTIATADRHSYHVIFYVANCRFMRADIF